MKPRLSLNSNLGGRARVLWLALFCQLLLNCALTPLAAQTSSVASPQTESGAPGTEEIERRLNDVTSALNQTQKALQQSLIEIQELRGELDALKLKTGTAKMLGNTATANTMNEKTAAPPQAPNGGDLEALREQQDAQQAEIAQHEQTKVESASKYALRVNGLVLFNAFSNVGVVDDADLPSIALPRHAGASHGSLGATVRQTLLGFEASGPHLWNARSSARLSVDFFGGVASNDYGYSSPTGLLRLRETDATLDWERTTAQIGINEPLITPLSPTSYATVAMPGLSASGNLWAWSPQLRVEQRIPLSDQAGLTLEGGLIDPGSSSYASIQLDTPVEASRRPGYEGRIAFHADRRAGGETRPFAIGLAGYSSDQYYQGGTKIHAWAATADWQIPLSRWMDISGEAYRGRSLGGLGGGGYKDVISGVDAVTGLTRTVAVEAVGGWGQLKFRFRPTLEANAAWGIDNALASNFNGLVLSSLANTQELNARNSSFIGNIIYRPRTYLIFSPEYRRLQSWQYDGPASIADIFTMTAGFQF